MGFFSSLFRFSETSYATTQKSLLDLASFTSDTSRGYLRERCDFAIPAVGTVSSGTFSMPSVAQLRASVQEAKKELLDSGRDVCEDPKFVVENIVGEARALHQAYEGAVIQAASQFNFLEFPSPRITPEAGIEGYVHDRTQGPACAMACAAGTAYRNYLVPVPFEDGKTRGQTADAQLNGLENVEAYLESHLKMVPWRVKNGYIDSNASKLEELNKLIRGNPQVGEEFISRLRIGVQEDTAATDIALEEDGREVLMTQTYNSAISIGYSLLPDSAWEPVARLVLDGSYEATLLVGLLKIIEARRNGTKPPPILLTKVGGGVFRNDDAWISASIARAIEKSLEHGIGMDIRIVHFGGVNEGYRVLEAYSS